MIIIKKLFRNVLIINMLVKDGTPWYSVSHMLQLLLQQQCLEKKVLIQSQKSVVVYRVK